MSTSDAYSAIEGVVDDWKLLGLNLGILWPTLTTIDIDPQKTMAEKKHKMLQTWMTGESMPTWSLLAEALRCPSSNHPRLAEKISRQQSKLCVCLHFVGQGLRVYG